MNAKPKLHEEIFSENNYFQVSDRIKRDGEAGEREFEFDYLMIYSKG